VFPGREARMGKDSALGRTPSAGGPGVREMWSKMRQTRTVVVRRPAALPLYILQILLSQEKFSPETSSASLFELNLILPNAEWTLRFIAYAARSAMCRRHS